MKSNMFVIINLIIIILIEIKYVRYYQSNYNNTNTNISLKQYLKNNSTVDHNFIDDFYSFYDKGQNEYDYIIDLDKLVFWLEVKKSHLKRLLEDNFKKDKDYIIEGKIKGVGKGIGGNNRKRVMLSYVCSKLLCMISKSPKSSVIKKFYIDLDIVVKITDFLKRHSLISSDFIDDFYSFYDEGQNEYDYVIDLEKLSNWMSIQKSHLKRLLEDNFEENEDYIIEEKKGGIGKGIGGNNRKRVMLTYVCSKLLCMLSRTEKANTIRRFYVELEKLLISYKDNIVNDLYGQLGIKAENKKIIEKNKDKGLIYVLKLDDTEIITDNDLFEAKLGRSIDLKERFGRIDVLPIVYVYITDNMLELENCLKNFLKHKQIVKGTETYKLNLAEIKETIKYCNKLKSQLIKQNTWLR